MQELLELFFVHEEKLTYFHFVHVGLKSFIGLPSFIGKKSLSCSNQERHVTRKSREKERKSLRCDDKLAKF